MSRPVILSTERLAHQLMETTPGTNLRSKRPISANTLLRHDGSVMPQCIGNASGLVSYLRNAGGSFNIQTSTTGTPAAPDIYFIKPPAGTVYLINRILIYLRDTTI